jgi:PAS domain S-box-containing protein
MKEVYAIDNTENNQANYDALKESEFRHRQIVEALPIAYYTCNPEGYILYCNEAAIKLWGRKPELGKDMWCGSWRIFGKDGAPLLLEECPMGIALKTGQPVKGEEIIIERPDGVRRNVLPHPKPVFGADGKIKEVVNVLVDITEHKYAKEALFESEDMFRGVADQTPMFLLMTNAEMKITYCNKLILDFLGFLNYMELMTPALETVLHPEEGDMLYAECNKAAAEQAHFSLECRFLEAKTRRYKWFLLKGSPREKKKQFAGFVVTAIDIDEQKKVQQ